MSSVHGTSYTHQGASPYVRCPRCQSVLKAMRIGRDPEATIRVMREALKLAQDSIARIDDPIFSQRYALTKIDAVLAETE